MLQHRINKHRSSPGHKALAQSVVNGYTYNMYSASSRKRAIEEAKRRCAIKGRACRVMYVNGKRVAQPKRRFALPARLTVYDGVSGKTQKMPARIHLSDAYAKRASLRVVARGRTICSGTRTISGYYTQIISARCFGKP